MKDTIASRDIAGLLFGTVRRQVLSLLLLRPEQSVHLREIARLIEAPAGATRRELQLLVGAGILRRTAIGNQVHYQADSDCPVQAELVLLLRKLSSLRYASSQARPLLRVADSAAALYAVQKTGGSARRALINLKILRRSVAGLCRRYHVKKLSLFGSVTRRDFRPTSDVDVLVEFLPDQPAGLGRMVDLREGLSALFGGRRVDLATAAILRNPHRRRTILQDLSVVYESR
jgi:predicted nucleotidyltransferase